MKKGMISVNIDMSEVFKEMHVMKKEVPAMMQHVFVKVAESVVVNWREEAHRGLRSTRAMYLRGLQEPEISKDQAVVALIGTLPNMLEQGASPFDIKKGFSASTKVVRKKGGGWYLTIPFRWATPGALGENEVFSAVMPSAVFDIAKELAPRTVQPFLPGVTRSEALREEDLPVELQGQQERARQPVYGAYTHKSNMYAGIVREEQMYEKTTQSKFLSFRRVSDKSDPLSWMHKGLVARDFAEKSVSNTNVDVVVANAVDEFLGS
jgi:hypothetical protein